MKVLNDFANTTRTKTGMFWELIYQKTSIDLM